METLLGIGIGYVILLILCFLIGVYITRWIFGIQKIITNLDKQTTSLENQNKLLTAQVKLLMNMARKSGVPIEEINVIGNDVAIEFLE